MKETWKAIVNIAGIMALFLSPNLTDLRPLILKERPKQATVKQQSPNRNFAEILVAKTPTSIEKENDTLNPALQLLPWESGRIPSRVIEQSFCFVNESIEIVKDVAEMLKLDATQITFVNSCIQSAFAYGLAKERQNAKIVNDASGESIHILPSETIYNEVTQLIRSSLSKLFESSRADYITSLVTSDRCIQSFKLRREVSLIFGEGGNVAEWQEKTTRSTGTQGEEGRSFVESRNDYFSNRYLELFQYINGE
jgi:hypothetical protein